MRVAGIMSGTSLDGIDVAIVDIRGRKVSTAAFHSKPYSSAVRARLFSAATGQGNPAEISGLNFLLGELSARAVIETCRRAEISLETIELIGSHGQTIFHEGAASTLQIGEASVIAERTGAPVVSDFRTRDIAAGGQGAPLVPYVDYLLFHHPRRGRVALNIGGIANVTAVPPGADSGKVIAFDTGPGNMVIDALTAGFTKGRQLFDRGGEIAARGQVNRKLLERLLQNPYYRRKPPKSAGREQYGDALVKKLIGSGLAWEDLIATATALTARTIADAIQQFVLPRMRVDDLIVSGGGVHNAELVKRLSDLPVRSSADFGIDPDAKEAIAFALLAYQTWRGRASNLPSATGARRPVILGKITR